ncbi:hypothetical protein H920_04021 [Fukomys damarensis]|uniref:Uncharacterized protein n=1 Tax=Fukomys damarensis TaxID=885580 RepID=A0A091DW19_FUKDA|nr:hypothetical protein H920_04021 [Fukomys damarensis]
MDRRETKRVQAAPAPRRRRGSKTCDLSSAAQPAPDCTAPPSVTWGFLAFLQGLFRGAKDQKDSASFFWKELS